MSEYVSFVHINVFAGKLNGSLPSGLQQLSMYFSDTQITDVFAKKLKGSLPAGLQQLSMYFSNTRITDVFARS